TLSSINGTSTPLTLASQYKAVEDQDITFLRFPNSLTKITLILEDNCPYEIFAFY
ncbi:179_t:CDS:1, partial [Funneliformis caledonium]